MTEHPILDSDPWQHDQIASTISFRPACNGYMSFGYRHGHITYCIWIFAGMPRVFMVSTCASSAAISVADMPSIIFLHALRRWGNHPSVEESASGRPRITAISANTSSCRVHHNTSDRRTVYPGACGLSILLRQLFLIKFSKSLWCDDNECSVYMRFNWVVPWLLFQWPHGHLSAFQLPPNTRIKQVRSWSQRYVFLLPQIPLLNTVFWRHLFCSSPLNHIVFYFGNYWCWIRAVQP